MLHTNNSHLLKINKLKDYLNSTLVDHSKAILLEPSLKDACSYCVVNNILSQQYGNLIENFVSVHFKYSKNKSADCAGDLAKLGVNYELKCSLGGKDRNRFNFVQIRPNHNCGFYIFVAYHVSNANVDFGGDVFVFKIHKTDLKQILLDFGSYAHGTIQKNGSIEVSLNDGTSLHEYALRTTIGDKLWNALLVYRINECEL
jgi:hypothetical protein